MDDETCNIVCSYLSTNFRKYNCEATLIFCDSEVNGEPKKINKIPKTGLFIKGRGGTDLTKGISWIENNLEKKLHKSTDVFVFTDGYTPWRKTNLNVYDIGHNSLNQLYNLIEENDIIFWNGSLGVIENKNYVIGSIHLIDKLLEQKNKNVIIGGGDTSTLIDKNGNIYVSTGGGALLELLENASKNDKYLIGLDIFT
jgi:hypothetical protein